MARWCWAALTAVWLALASVAWAADTVPPGNYKFTLLADGQALTLWLLKIDNKDGKVTGEVIAHHADIPNATIAEIGVKDGQIRLTFDLKAKQARVGFEGKVPDGEKKKIHGTFAQGQKIMLAYLEPTSLKSLEGYDLALEILGQPNPGPELFQATLAVLNQAAAKGLKDEDVRSWANRAFKMSEDYGSRWQFEVALQLAEILAKEEKFAPVAVQYARQAERLLKPGEKVALQQRTLNALAQALTKAGKTDEAKEVTARLEKIDPVVPAKFAGRKAASERVVLVELFTGAECPPCVAADLAFDALGKTYKAKDVVLLQYHLHIPRADPLTNPDTEARRGYYKEEIAGTPTIFFNGKGQDFGGGGFDEAQERYDEYIASVNPLLEKPARVKLKAAATQKGSKVNITAEALEMDDPGDKVRLRLALVEDQVDYRGGNRLAHHHSVVRALPGGAAGLAVKDKNVKQAVTVDLDELRQKLTKYLDEAAKDLNFPNKERPMEFKKLRVIAFVQNDATKEILQAVQTDVVVE